MNKTFKKVLACVLSLAMVATSATVYNTEVNAALAGTDIETNILNADYNLALNKATEMFPATSAEGQQAFLNDGIVDNTNNNHVALSNAWGYAGETYAIIDLGDYYEASSLDSVMVQYKDAADNDTVMGKTYYIAYSIDGASYNTVYTSDTVTAFDENNCITTDVSAYTGTVRYVKIGYPATPTYGIQINEIAVFSANPVKGEVASCENAAAVTATAGGEGEIIVNITAGEGQDGYTYNVFVDDSSSAALMNCVAGQDYTISGLASGQHTVKVVSVYNGALSEGLVSDPVTVKTVMDMITDPTKNLAYQKTYTLSSGTSTEGTGSVTDGDISANSYVTSSKGGTESWFEIDLGEALDPDYITAVHVWYRINFGGCYPEQGGQEIQFSQDKSEWITVGSLTQDEFNTFRGEAPFQVPTTNLDTSDINAVRYVRVNYPTPPGYGPQVSEIAVIGTAVAATPAVDVTAPTNVAATSPAYNTVDVTFDGVEGADYTYEVTLGDEKKTVEAGGTVTFTGVISGTYTATVRSVDAEGNKSAIVSSNAVTVEDSFTFTTSATTATTFPDTNDNGNNYARYDAITAEASSGDAYAALDNNAGTRWESASSDPQSITVNFGSVMSVKEVDMSWEAANSRDYTVEVSTDGTAWETVAIVAGAPTEQRVDTIVLKEAVDAQYVKVTGTARNLTYGHSIWEMAIYGTSEEVVVEEVAPDQSTYDTDWIKLVSTDANAAAKSTYGTTYFVSESFRDAHIPYNDILGLYDDHATSPYHQANCTVTGSAFVLALVEGFTADTEAGKINTSMFKSIWIDGVKYESGSELVYFEGDQIHLSQSLFDIGDAEEKVFAVTMRTVEKDYTFGVKVAKAVYYDVTVDGGEAVEVEEGTTYTLPTDSALGYFCDGVAYKAGAEVTVNADMAFTAIGEVSVAAAQGAGIRYEGSAGIRFQATVTASDAVLASTAVTTGMIITAEDIYNLNGELTLEAIADKNEYAAINVVNSGWFAGQVGTYCGSITNIAESNYIRNFVARAYVTITYADGTTTTVYSNMTGARSIKGVATAVQAAGYAGIDAAYYSVIDAYAAAK